MIEMMLVTIANTEHGFVEVKRQKIQLTKKGRWLNSVSGIYTFDAKTLKPTQRCKRYRLEKIEVDEGSED